MSIKKKIPILTNNGEERRTRGVEKLDLLKIKIHARLSHRVAKYPIRVHHRNYRVVRIKGHHRNKRKLLLIRDQLRFINSAAL